MVDVNYKNCPAVWRQVKTRVLNDEAVFVSLLKETWEKRKKRL